ERVALLVDISTVTEFVPASGSWKEIPERKSAVSSLVVRLVGAAMEGATLIPVTCKEKVSDTVSPFPSLAVILISKVPTSALPGVPENVLLLPVKLSQEGKAPPPDSSAV